LLSMRGQDIASVGRVGFVRSALDRDDPMKRSLDIDMSVQPNDFTCGPTCLHSIYRYYGDDISLDDVISGVTTLEDGGAIASHLAIHALKKGYKSVIYSYNMQVFDPTWKDLPPEKLSEKLIAQRAAKVDAKLSVATDAYLEFLALGGVVRFQDLTPALIRKYVKRQIPILTGLSSTYLYQAVRERRVDNGDDDIRGYPAGHFVIIHGYNTAQGTVMVADPFRNNPALMGQHYEVNLYRLVCAIMLGIVTYDSNLLIIEP